MKSDASMASVMRKCPRVVGNQMQENELAPGQPCLNHACARRVQAVGLAGRRRRVRERAHSRIQNPLCFCFFSIPCQSCLSFFPGGAKTVPNDVLRNRLCAPTSFGPDLPAQPQLPFLDSTTFNFRHPRGSALPLEKTSFRVSCSQVSLWWALKNCKNIDALKPSLQQPRQGRRLHTLHTWKLIIARPWQAKITVSPKLHQRAKSWQISSRRYYILLRGM